MTMRHVSKDGDLATVNTKSKFRNIPGTMKTEVISMQDSV